MRLAVRAASSPRVESVSRESSAVRVVTGAELSARPEALSGSTIEIPTGIGFTIQPLLLRPIETNVSFSITPSFQVRVEVGMQMRITAAAADFGYSRDLVAAAQSDLSDATTDFVLIGQTFTDPTFRTVANGGRVESADGDDIKFTASNNVQFAYNLISYDGSAGTILYDLKFPTWTFTNDVRHRLFYGNAGIADPLSDPAACYSRTAGVFTWPAGADVSGNGRSLTASGVTAGTLKGPAGVFLTTSHARATGPTWAALDAISVEFWVNPTTAGRIVRIGSTTTGTGPGIDIRIEDGSWEVTKTTASGSQVSAGPTGVVLGQDYHVVVVLRSGVTNAIYVNGVALALTSSGGVQSGPIKVSATDELAIGNPTVTTRPGFAGTLGRVFFWPFGLSAGWVRTSYRFQVDQAAILGISAENAAAVANRGPVAVPMAAAAEAGANVDVDVAVRAFDPNSDLLTATVPSQPTTGVSQITADGKVRYRPNGGTGGQTHTVPFRVSDGLKTSDSIIRISVSAPSAGFIELTAANGYPGFAVNTDITEALQLLPPPPASKTYRLPAGTYYAVVVGRDTNTLQSGVRLSGALNASGDLLTIIKVRDNTYSFDAANGQRQTYRQVFNMSNVNNIIIQDLLVDGNRTNQKIINNSSGAQFVQQDENGGWHGFAIRSGSRNIQLLRVRATYCGTDGLKIDNAQDVEVTDCEFTYNRRMGCAPSNGTRLTFTRSKFNFNGKNGSRTSTPTQQPNRPCSGFDLELNVKSDRGNDITLQSCEFNDNLFAGFFVDCNVRARDEPGSPGCEINNLRVIDCDAFRNAPTNNESYQVKLRGATTNNTLIRGCRSDTYMEHGGGGEVNQVPLYGRHNNFIIEDCVLGGRIQFRQVAAGSTFIVRRCDLPNGDASIVEVGTNQSFTLTKSGNT